MGRSIESIIMALPRERRARVNGKAQQIAAEMIARAMPSTENRRAADRVRSHTDALAVRGPKGKLKLEKRHDLLLSTLARHAHALGGELKLIVRMSDGREILIDVRCLPVKPEKRTVRKSRKPASPRG